MFYNQMIRTGLVVTIPPGCTDDAGQAAVANGTAFPESDAAGSVVSGPFQADRGWTGGL